MSTADRNETPPFPDDVATAPLLCLSLNKLLANDEEESNRLFSASKDLGFFYLDLRATSDGESILADADKLFVVGEAFFNLSLEEKCTYDFSRQKTYFGYCHDPGNLESMYD